MIRLFCIMFLLYCPHSHLMALLFIGNNREFYCEDPDRKRQLLPRAYFVSYKDGGAAEHNR